MQSAIVHRSVVVGGRNTTVTLEDDFWDCVKEISTLRGVTRAELVAEIDRNRQQKNLSSAIRLYVLDYFRSRAAPQQDGAAVARPDAR